MTDKLPIEELPEKLERAAISVDLISFDENICITHSGEDISKLLKDASNALKALQHERDSLAAQLATIRAETVEGLWGRSYRETAANPDCPNCGKGYSICGEFRKNSSRVYHMRNGIPLPHVPIRSLQHAEPQG